MIIVDEIALRDDLNSGSVRAMPQRIEINGSSEHGLYLRLFVTTSGGV